MAAWKDVRRVGQLAFTKKRVGKCRKGSLCVVIAERKTQKGKEYYTNLPGVQTILHENEVELCYNDYSQVLFNYSTYSLNTKKRAQRAIKRIFNNG